MIPRILDMLFLSAPHLAGDDVRQRSEERRRYRFYPRHPRGWRRRSDGPAAHRRFCFYPRHPRGWRLDVVKPRWCAISVSIHATLAGGDLEHPSQLGEVSGVSIHATLAGGDVDAIWAARLDGTFLSTPPSRVATFPIIQAINKCYLFLSTPPSRVATMPMGCAPSARSVSIHATLAGGD